MTPPDPTKAAWEEALASVRRLIRTGNNKSYWRKREAEILAELYSRGREG